MGSFSWHIPTGQQQCRALNIAVDCNFALYANATGLTEDEKLAPNPNITGGLIYKSFLWTAIASLIISAVLNYDKIVYHTAKDTGRRRDIAVHKHWAKVVHAAETILVQLSDQQLASALSLLFALNDQTCTISAFDFNVVCTMLLISIVVHLNALINTSDYIRKGKWAATLRICSVFTQLVFTGIVFSARNTTTWPFQAQSLAIMPAMCFENANAKNGYGLSDLYDLASNVTNATTAAASQTNNGTDTFLHTIQEATGKYKGLGEFAALACFVVVALIVVFIEAGWMAWATRNNEKAKPPGLVSITSSIISTIVAMSFLIYGAVRYNNLTSGMHSPELYQVDKIEPLSFSQILPLAFLASNVYQVFAALSGSLPDGKRVHRYAIIAEETIRQGPEGDSTENVGLMNIFTKA